MTSHERADSAELRRRIRRLLAAIRSIAADMQIRGRDVHESARHLTDRVGALGRAAATSISSGMDLKSLVLDELLAQGIHDSASFIEGPDVRLNGKSAEVMTLAVHELAANAMEFGALSRPQGRLRVLWWFEESAAPRLHFEWTEKGTPWGANERRKSGFGSQVIKRLVASELHGDGNMVFSADGLLCRIEFPSAGALHVG